MEPRWTWDAAFCAQFLFILTAATSLSLVCGDDTTELTLSDVVKTTPSNFWDQLEALKNETSENILGSLKKEIWHKKKVPIETEEPQSTLPPSTTLTPPTTFTPLPTTIQPTTLPPPTTFTPLPFSTQPLSTILTPTLPSTTSQPNSTPPPTTGPCPIGTCLVGSAAFGAVGSCLSFKLTEAAICRDPTTTLCTATAFNTVCTLKGAAGLCLAVTSATAPDQCRRSCVTLGFDDIQATSATTSGGLPISGVGSLTTPYHGLNFSYTAKTIVNTTRGDSFQSFSLYAPSPPNFYTLFFAGNVLGGFTSALPGALFDVQSLYYANLGGFGSTIPFTVRGSGPNGASCTYTTTATPTILQPATEPLITPACQNITSFTFRTNDPNTLNTAVDDITVCSYLNFAAI